MYKLSEDDFRELYSDVQGMRGMVARTGEELNINTAEYTAENLRRMEFLAENILLILDYIKR